MKITVDNLMEHYGYSRKEAEREVQRATCDHEYGPMAMRTFMGCTRTCTKCGQMTCEPNHCGQADERRTTSAPPKGSPT